MSKDYVGNADIIRGNTFSTIRGELERHFSESKTPVILVDTIGEDALDDDVGYAIYRYSKKPVYGKEVEPQIIAEISFDDIYIYGLNKKLSDNIRWDRLCINSYLAKHCCRNKIFITIGALNMIENLPSNCH